MSLSKAVKTQLDKGKTNTSNLDKLFKAFRNFIDAYMLTILKKTSIERPKSKPRPKRKPKDTDYLKEAMNNSSEYYYTPRNYHYVPRTFGSNG